MTQPEAEREPVTESMSRPEPEPGPQLRATPPSDVPDVVDREPDSPAEPGLRPEPAATWDQQRYTTEIEEPDWWTPEASVWEEPSPEPVADEPAVDQEAPAVPEIADGEASEMVPIDASAEAETPARSEPAADEPVTPSVLESPSVEQGRRVEPSEPYLGEEPILWYGRRSPADASPAWPREDAGEEMEVGLGD